jgi:hypothetical protein
MPFYLPQQTASSAAAPASKYSIGKNAVNIALISIFTIEVFGQNPSLIQDASSDDFTFLYLGLGVVGAALLGAVYWMRSKRRVEMYPKAKTETTIRRVGVRPAPANGGDRKVDDWIQAGFTENKNKNGGKVGSNGAAKKSNGKSSKKNFDDFENFKQNSFGKETASTPANEIAIDSSFWQLTTPHPLAPLPSANGNESVLDALEQLKEDDDDEMMRSLAIRVLTAAKTQESVEGLAQVALYDSSARLRIEAVMALAAFDHESVFEPILLAGADPSREVRAAAARALSRLSFERSDAFVRVIGSRDEERLRLAALACVESGFAARAFERLSSTDGKQSYEAFAILTLLTKAGEFQPILQTIAEHPSVQVRLATVKVLHNLNSSRMSAALYELSLREDLPEEVKNALKELLFHLKTTV